MLRDPGPAIQSGTVGDRTSKYIHHSDSGVTFIGDPPIDD